MPRRIPAEPELQVLTATEAARLLNRASELDAASGAATVAQLRSAALEAGISPLAFEAALAEVRAQDELPTHSTAAPAGGIRRRTVAVVATALVALLAFFAAMRTVPVGATEMAAAPMTEEAFLLRCVAAGEAAELIRPLLPLPGNTVRTNAQAPRVLTVRATREQLARVRGLLEKHEGVYGPACAINRPGATQ